MRRDLLIQTSPSLLVHIYLSTHRRAFLAHICGIVNTHELLQRDISPSSLHSSEGRRCCVTGHQNREFIGAFRYRLSSKLSAEHFTFLYLLYMCAFTCLCVVIVVYLHVFTHSHGCQVISFLRFKFSERQHGSHPKGEQKKLLKATRQPLNYI